MKKVLVVLAIVIVAAVLNVLNLPTIMKNTAAPEPQHTRPSNLDAASASAGLSSSTGATELTWASFADVKVRMNLEDIVDANIPPEIKQLEGKTIRISGVGFFMKDGVIDEKVQKFVLLPPRAIIWCCVPTPKPHPEWTVLVDSSANPWPIPKTPKPFQVAISGTLVLNPPKDADYLYTITDARIVALRPEEILDTSGLNVCEEVMNEPSMQVISGL